MIMAKQAGEELRATFQITTGTPLPVGEQVFITGNDDALGNWQGDGFPLARQDDNIWSGTVHLSTDRPVKYKITRGTWTAEEVLADDSIPEDYTFPEKSDQPVEHYVHHWKDHRLGAPRITGNYRIHDAVKSPLLRFDRKVIVWLPPSYESEPDRRYPVLYMHDGQQVFDPRTSTWGHDWEVDEWSTKLIAENRLQEVIVVGVYSTDDRLIEYNPSQIGADYARFLIDELKPFIDEEYRTLPDRDHTAVAGSSFGATISFYLAWTRPDVYFGAACLSPALEFKDDEFDLDLVRKSRGAPDIKIYLYCGEGDDIEQELKSGMKKMSKLLKKAGFKEGENLQVLTDPEGEHNEASWARHTDHWLLFLFGR